MSTQISKWGGSAAVRIPKSCLDSVGMSQGSVVEVSVDAERRIIIQETTPKYELQDLLGQINENNIHAETETGAVVGRETW